MNCTEEQFFILLRAGLWDKPVEVEAFSEKINWNDILKIASIQTVNGLLFDGISNLPSDKQHPTLLMRRLYQTILRIEQSHKLLKETIEKIVSALQKESIRPILFKGQGVSSTSKKSKSNIFSRLLLVRSSGRNLLHVLNAFWAFLKISSIVRLVFNFSSIKRLSPSYASCN